MSQDECVKSAPPMMFDGYRVTMALSQGQKSAVYSGHDAVLDRPVFVRFLHIPGPATDRRKHFFAQARTAVRVQHPNVVTVYRVGEADGWPYMILEYVHGQSLASIKRPVPWEKALDYAFGLARGLSAAHRKNILHRDLRASNVLLSGEGEIKILDFGLSEFIDAGSTAFELAAQGSADAAVPPVADRSLDAMGGEGALPQHQAPELQRGEPATTRSDVFALGALLYELCSGSLPPTRPVAAQGLAGGPGPQFLPLGQLVPSMNSHFAEIIDQCLESRPSRRYASGEYLLEALELLMNRAAKSDLPEGNPYRGLLRFEAEHRSLFFGRRSEIGTLLDRLHTEPCHLVAAESGIGKSSLCRAGVLPLVREGAFSDGRKWQVVSLVPGRQPIRALVSALRPVLKWEEAALLDCLQNAPATLARELSTHLAVGEGLLLFMDQLEELVTIADREEARRVAEALGSLLDRTAGVRLLMTARSDFLSRIAALPILGDSVSRCLYILRPLGPERLREVVVGPARAKGVRFESPELIASLVDSTAHTDGALPLLQFALAELWEAREGTTISAAALQTIGGVTGALARHADHVLSGMSEPQRTAARHILMALVTIEGTRARRGEAELLGGWPGKRDVLERLVKGRIVVARDSAEGPAYEVAHEALIKGWGTLRQWLEQYLESRAVRQRFEIATGEWRRLGRLGEALWSLRQLAETRVLASEDIGVGEREFISSSQRWTRR